MGPADGVGGQTLELEFEASRAGQFEIELHPADAPDGVAVGIFTVLNAAPLGLALLHQAGALLLVLALVRARFAAAYPPEQRIER